MDTGLPPSPRASRKSPPPHPAGSCRCQVAQTSKKRQRKEPHPEAVEGGIGRALPGPLDLCCPPLSAVPVPESPAPRAGRGSRASPSQPVMGPRSQRKLVTASLLKSPSRRELVTEPEKRRSPTDHERHEVPARLAGWSSKLKSAREIAQG